MREPIGKEVIKRQNAHMWEELLIAQCRLREAFSGRGPVSRFLKETAKTMRGDWSRFLSGEQNIQRVRSSTWPPSRPKEGWERWGWLQGVMSPLHHTIFQRAHKPDSTSLS